MPVVMTLLSLIARALAFAAGWISLSACASIDLPPATAAARASTSASAVVTPDGAYAIRLTTLRELRQRESFRSTVPQQYDYSCGSAAIATLLSYHYGVRVDEATVFRTMFENGDQERIRRDGFSLLDMKRYLEAQRFVADGYNVSLDDLVQAKVPAIALVREAGYNHFVVIKGVYDNKVLVGNPSSGTRILTRSEFDAIWTVRILLVIRSHLNQAKFNVPDHWTVRRRAPLSAGVLHDSGATAMIMLPGRNDF